MKHLLLIPAALLVSAISLAQLYVAPNENGTPLDPLDDTDSFIYVNDQILFVEQDVNLTLNTVSPEYRASIYLRNGAQLIQGETPSLNSGDGHLSIYRENPGSDAWDYTYYGSPVGDIRTNPMAAAGNLNHGSRSIFSIVNTTRSKSRFITPNHNGYFTGTDLYISDRWIHTKGTGIDANWIRMGGVPLATPGSGFIMKGVNVGGPNNAGNNDYVYDFRGRPNNGTIEIPITELSGGRTSEEVLTGNPYPSALDLNRLFYDTRDGDLDGTDTFENSEISEILFYDEDRSINSHLYVDNKAGHGIWVPGMSNPETIADSNPTGTNPGLYVEAPFFNYDGSGNPTTPTGSVGGYYQRRFAPVGQGFYLKTIDSDTPNDGSLNIVSIKNQYRRFIKEDSGNSDFRTPIGSSSLSATETRPRDNRIPQIRLYTYFSDSHFRDMILAFAETSTNFYDRGLDARHPMDAIFAEAYFPVKVDENEDESIDEFVIQTVPWEVEKRIPYAIVLDEQTEVVVQVVEAVKITNPVFLFDSTLNTYTLISGNSTATLNLPAGDYVDRFYIVFKGSSSDPTAGFVPDSERTQIIEEITGNVDFFQNNRAAQLEIMNPEAYTLKYAHIFDMTGKLVTTRTDLGNSTNYSISTASMADGVYLVKLVTSDNVSIDYKAIVTNK